MSRITPHAPTRPGLLDTTGPLDAELSGPLSTSGALDFLSPRRHEDTQRLDGKPGAPAGAGPSGPDTTPQVDQVGRYSLEQRLGQGGLGTVWSAYDTVLARQVAVKTLTIAAAPGQREELAARVLDEARAAARLSHPHIVTVHDAGVSPEGAYIAMELLRGKDLADLLRSGWRPSPEQAALIVRRVADALGYAHSKGVIHRDVKPANIFMVGRTRPVVLDFGIARLINRDQGGPALGSPYYAAPEQYDGRECDQRSDVYSLGVVLYELLTGQRPYNGSSLDEIRQAVRTGRAQRPTQIIAAVPPALETLVMQAIDIDPAARPRSAGAMARELRTWLATLPNAPNATWPQQPPAASADPARAQRPNAEAVTRRRAELEVASLPPAANPGVAPAADFPSLPTNPAAGEADPASRGTGTAPGRPSLLPAVLVACVLGLLVLVGWLMLSR
ncbi:serine/threonine protein kinase [Leptothrix cholodnii SP-6]|uniref:Serine/threonine protein kinase n=1 Tax=Leptothrix cholodnii (strain ATCC 51168 / LMG 8142 / SP-6) TaxID=395495 RepID=B1XYF9_LEPCP|nr:serine/threonine-protein kinase [Leptothrix cholodnii]ACB35204.1 serine/threonine protein kinase [Leptothrix cholodnii SP-6]